MLGNFRASYQNNILNSSSAIYTSIYIYRLPCNFSKVCYKEAASFALLLQISSLVVGNILRNALVLINLFTGNPFIFVSHRKKKLQCVQSSSIKGKVK